MSSEAAGTIIVEAQKSESHLFRTRFDQKTFDGLVKKILDAIRRIGAENIAEIRFRCIRRGKHFSFEVDLRPRISSICPLDVSSQTDADESLSLDSPLYTTSYDFIIFTKENKKFCHRALQTSTSQPPSK